MQLTIALPQSHLNTDDPQYGVFACDVLSDLFFSQGECWSGPKAGETYNRAGREQINTCVTRDYQKCNTLDFMECVGEEETNFVYGVDLAGSLQYCAVIIK